MSFYPPKISERFHTPKNAGRVSNANAVGTHATFVCGAVLRFTLRIDADSKRIEEAKFKSSGCGFLIAAAETLAELIVGKYLIDLHSLDKQFFDKEVKREIGEFPENRTHCRELALNALQNAFADLRSGQVEEWRGEKALVCTCFSVSEETIENLIKEKSLETVENVTDACRAGGGCGSCQPLIEDILENYRRETDLINSDF